MSQPATRGSPARTAGSPSELNQLTDGCLAQGGSVPFCAQLSRARDRAVVVAVGSGLLDRLAGKVATDEAAIAKGAGALAPGQQPALPRRAKISSASGELSRSTTKLLTGATSVAQGAVTVNDAAVQLESGTEQTSSAATSLVSGSDSVSSGASSADSGAQQLSSGLEKGAKESPTYSSSQQDALAVAVSEPVQLSHSEQHDKHGNGWLLAALVAVILWLAALVGALGVDLSAARRQALALVVVTTARVHAGASGRRRRAGAGGGGPARDVDLPGERRRGGAVRAADGARGSDVLVARPRTATRGSAAPES